MGRGGNYTYICYTHIRLHSLSSHTRHLSVHSLIVTYMTYLHTEHTLEPIIHIQSVICTYIHIPYMVFDIHSTRPRSRFHTPTRIHMHHCVLSVSTITPFFFFVIVVDKVRVRNFLIIFWSVLAKPHDDEIVGQG